MNNVITNSIRVGARDIRDVVAITCQRHNTGVTLKFVYKCGGPFSAHPADGCDDDLYVHELIEIYASPEALDRLVPATYQGQDREGFGDPWPDPVEPLLGEVLLVMDDEVSVRARAKAYGDV